MSIDSSIVHRVVTPVRWQPSAPSLRDWLTHPRVTAPLLWVLPPFVQTGEVALLSAPPKTGKSSLVSQLAAAVTVGGESLDGKALKPASVLWLALDEPMRRLVPRLVQLGADTSRL